MRLISLFFSLLVGVAVYAAPKTDLGEGSDEANNLRLLTWWEYISPNALSAARRNGFEIDVTDYRSMEVGLSRLAADPEKFDVAILPKPVVEALSAQGFFSTSPELLSLKTRSYVDWIKRSSHECVPYLWSATVFTFDPRFTKHKPANLKDLFTLKSDGYRIGIIDDPLEVGARFELEQNEICGSSTKNKMLFEAFGHCKDNQIATLVEKFHRSEIGDFRSSIETVLVYPRTAAYGWHGEAAGLLEKASWIEFKSPEKNPVVGVDYVCAIKKKTPQSAKMKKVEGFIKFLTNESMTRENVSKTQYFSPYKGDSAGLHPKVKALKDQIEGAIARSESVILSTPSPNAHRALNAWWRKVRYEKK